MTKCRRDHGFRSSSNARSPFGYSRIWVLLRREGSPVNKKRVHQRYRLDGQAVRSPAGKVTARLYLPELGRIGGWAVPYTTDIGDG
jgi:hypothetical protein